MAVNYFATTNAAGSFNIQTTGYVAGTLLDNPAELMKIAQGVVSSAEVNPMWGGVGISEYIPYPAGVTTPNGYGASPDTHNAMGGRLHRAQTIWATSGSIQPLTGFTVFNMSQALLNWPQSPVPTAAPGASINYVRLGSGVRIALACNPILASLEGGNVFQQVSWDFDAQELVPYVAAYAKNVLTGLTWTSTGGGSVTGTTTGAHGLVVGDAFSLEGNVPGAFNGEFVAAAGTSGTTLNFLLPAASNPGPVTTLGYLVGGGGAVACEVLSFSIGNCMVPVFDGTNATWNRSGSCAVVQLNAMAHP